MPPRSTQAAVANNNNKQKPSKPRTNTNVAVSTDAAPETNNNNNYYKNNTAILLPEEVFTMGIDEAETVQDSSILQNNNNNNKFNCNDHRRRSRSPEQLKTDSISDQLIKNNIKNASGNDDDGGADAEPPTDANAQENDDGDDDSDDGKNNNNCQDSDQEEQTEELPTVFEDFENSEGINMANLLLLQKSTSGGGGKSSAASTKKSANNNPAPLTDASRDQIIIAEFERLAGLRSPKTIFNTKEKNPSDKKKKPVARTVVAAKNNKNKNDDDDDNDGDDDDDESENGEENLALNNNNNNNNEAKKKNNIPQKQDQVPAVKIPAEYSQLNFDSNRSASSWFLLNNSKIFREPLKSAPTVPIDALSAPLCRHEDSSCSCLLYMRGFDFGNAGTDARTRNSNIIRRVIHRCIKERDFDLFSPVRPQREAKYVANITFGEFLQKCRWQGAYEKYDEKISAKISWGITGSTTTKINDTALFDPETRGSSYLQIIGNGLRMGLRDFPNVHPLPTNEQLLATVPILFQIADGISFEVKNISSQTMPGYEYVNIMLLMKYNPDHETSAVHAAHQLRFALELATELRPAPLIRDGVVSFAQQRLLRQKEAPKYGIPFDFLPPQDLSQSISRSQWANIATLFLRAKKIDSRFLLSFDWNDASLLPALRSRFVDCPEALPLQWPLGLSPRDQFIVNKIVRFLNAEETFKIVVPRGQQSAREALAASPVSDELFPANAKFRLPPGLAIHQHQKETIAWMRRMELEGADSFLHVRLPSKTSDGTLHLSPLLSTFFATRPAHGKLHQLLECRDLNNFRRGGLLASTVGMGKTLMVVSVALLDVAENDAKSADNPTKFPFITDKSCRCFVPFAGSSKKAFLDAACTTSEKETAEQGFDLYKKSRHLQLAVKATLILAPVTLVKQWKSEIEKFFSNANVIVYHASGSRQNISYEQIAAADFVVTSYELYKNQMKKEAAQTNAAGWCFSPIVYGAPNCFNNAFGSKTKIITQLSRIRFRRVVFDEFHKSGGLESMNLATDLVECDYIWAVSGTPLHPSLWNSGFMRHLIAPIPIIQKYHKQIGDSFVATRVNKFDESEFRPLFSSAAVDSLFPFQREGRYTVTIAADRGQELDNFICSTAFLGHFNPEQAKNSSTAKNDHIFFCKDSPEDYGRNWLAGSSSHCVVNYQLLSFLAKFMLRHTQRDSAELSNIQVTEKIVDVKLTKKEYERYCETLELIKNEYRALAARGRVNTRILRVIGLLNKLRHSACDPFAVTVDIANALQFEGGTQFDNENARRSIVTIPAKIFGGLVFPNYASSKFFSLDGYPHIQQDQLENGKDYAFAKHFSSIEGLREDLEGLLDEQPQLPTCALCAGDVMQPTVVRCGHVYCRECILEFAKHQAQGGPNATLCPICRAKTMADSDKKALLSFPLPPVPEGQEAEDDKKDDEDIPLSQIPPVVPPKVRAVVRLMQDTLAKDPAAKFVIFTVYVAQALRQEFLRLGIQSVYIDGSTSMEHRGRCVEQFQNPASTMRAFILSTRIANCGLTLTAAANMIIVEPATSKDVDIQMIGRIRRIGQKSAEVFVHRLVSLGTVEVPLREAVAQQSLSLAGGKSEEQKTKSVELMQGFFEHQIDLKVTEEVQKSEEGLQQQNREAEEEQEEKKPKNVNNSDSNDTNSCKSEDEVVPMDHSQKKTRTKKNVTINGEKSDAKKKSPTVAAKTKKATPKSSSSSKKKAKVADKKVPARKAAGKKKEVVVQKKKASPSSRKAKK